MAWVLTRPATHVAGWPGLRVPLRSGVLCAAAAVDQPAGGLDALDCARDGVGAVSRAVRPFRRRGAPAARLADLVRVGVGGPGVVQVGRSRSADFLGGQWHSVKPMDPCCRWSSSAVSLCCPCRSCWWVQRDRDHPGDLCGGCGPSSADAGGRESRRAVVLPGICICLVLFADGRRLAAGAALGYRVGWRTRGHRGGGAGQCAPARAAVQ